MARINCKLYGLNGYHLKYAMELTSDELTRLPEFHAKANAEVQKAQESGDAERVDEIARAVRGSQLTLFAEE